MKNLVTTLAVLGTLFSGVADVRGDQAQDRQDLLNYYKSIYGTDSQGSGNALQAALYVVPTRSSPYSVLQPTSVFDTFAGRDLYGANRYGLRGVTESISITGLPYVGPRSGMNQQLRTDPDPGVGFTVYAPQPLVSVGLPAAPAVQGTFGPPVPVGQNSLSAEQIREYALLISPEARQLSVTVEQKQIELTRAMQVMGSGSRGATQAQAELAVANKQLDAELDRIGGILNEIARGAGSGASQFTTQQLVPVGPDIRAGLEGPDYWFDIRR